MISSWAEQTFRPLRIPAYRLLWISTLFQFQGIMTLEVTRGFLAFELTDSNAALGGLYLAFGVPLLVVMAWAGVLADRVSKRRLLIATQVFLALQAGALAALEFADLTEYWMLLVQSALFGVTAALMAPTRLAITGELVDTAELGNSVVLQQGTIGLARIAGPPLGGALIAVPLVGVGGVFALVAVYFVLSAYFVWKLPRVPIVRTADSDRGGAAPARPSGSFIVELREGFRYVRRRPALITMVLLAYALALTAFPYVVFLPAVVKDVFDRGAFELGLINGAAAVGGVALTLAVGPLAGRPAGWTAYTAICLAFGALLMAFAVTPTYLAALAVAVLLGGAEVGFIALAMALAMTYTHRAYDGRVQSIMLSSFAFFGIIAYPLGLLADQIGIRPMLFMQGVAGVLAVSAVLLNGRRIGARADAHPPELGDVPLSAGG